MHAGHGFVATVVAAFEARAQDREAEAAHEAAAVYRRCAALLREEWERFLHAPLDMKGAMAVSGYSENGVRAWQRRHGLSVLTAATLPSRPLALGTPEGDRAECAA